MVKSNVPQPRAPLPKKKRAFPSQIANHPQQHRPITNHKQISTILPWKWQKNWRKRKGAADLVKKRGQVVDVLLPELTHDVHRRVVALPVKSRHGQHPTGTKRERLSFGSAQRLFDEERQQNSERLLVWNQRYWNVARFGGKAQTKRAKACAFLYSRVFPLTGFYFLFFGIDNFFFFWSI